MQWFTPAKVLFNTWIIHIKSVSKILCVTADLQERETEALTLVTYNS